ncbi:MAG: hypothetical protein Q4A83_08885 [Bacillota bacterium]|nr:hypothetical protein [Bacillota bacterium]
MGKIWKVLGIIVGIALLLGIICIGVGFITDGNLDRIKNLLEANYGLGNLRSIFEELMEKLPKLNPLT